MDFRLVVFFLNFLLPCLWLFTCVFLLRLLLQFRVPVRPEVQGLMQEHECVRKRQAAGDSSSRRQEEAWAAGRKTTKKKRVVSGRRRAIPRCENVWGLCRDGGGNEKRKKGWFIESYRQKETRSAQCRRKNRAGHSPYRSEEGGEARGKRLGLEIRAKRRMHSKRTRIKKRAWTTSDKSKQREEEEGRSEREGGEGRRKTTSSGCTRE